MKRFVKNVLGWLLSICIAFVIVFFLKTFIGMPTTVKGTSMAPTCFPEEKLILSTWSTNFNRAPNRGDIVTFEAPSVTLVKSADSSNPTAIYKEDSKNLYEKVMYYGLGITKSSYIKRVIGKPGDHVEIKNGKVYINGGILEEPYLSQTLKTDMSSGGEFSDVIVPEGYVYVLGDNRNASSDSRRFGCIPISKIEGKVAFRWWPLKKIGTV
ncbi:MAG: signal peptidase I [Clostridia bacterium]|nr:signal peptidase I [Clostridia bacterium]